ncbi:MAG TPA: cupin domain-containing protein [Solirubrobacteraceae bacterium]|jgi:mannose-6-phosphate isomerase-like protein (cupin superfamily)|nr:cupin domain-containing protein [Solirubrobacteraceae bacterium]
MPEDFEPPTARDVREGPRVVWMPGGVRTEVHLAERDTAGAFCLLVDHPTVGWSLPPHIHTDAAETIHVVEGEFAMEVDGQAMRLGPGETVHVPRGVVHSGANVGSGAGRRVLIFSPAGMERFFLEAGSPTQERPPEPASVLAAARSHGWEFPAVG